ncbi:J domain-containing protein [Ancylobacter sp. 6x-1]|uniref:J domain-containing protein n=1 Tax=Ancylobacter crimeensis TaxID=2579147 RepID=A0ABT0DB52_9HYPH|nr:J domain-containing protein [Ancylobacter crimeensis]MCK0197104.1 J domain-containing protein [Ancylobacter crimeensis]
MREPYEVLGVARNASQDDIKRAFRRLAKKLHPDANTSDPKAQDKFAELNTAHEILSDPEARGKYDRGEIDGEGKPKFQGYPGGGAGFGGAGFGQGGPGGFRRTGPNGETIFESFHFDDDSAARRGRQGANSGFEDVFSDLFGRFRSGGGRASSEAAPKGGDIEIVVPVPLERVVEGGPVKVALPGGSTVEIKVPAGVSEGHRLRLKGKGEASPFGGAPGDAYVVVHYATHPQFRVDGVDLRLDLAVPLQDAVLGGKLRVPTLGGSVDLTIPAWTQNGRTFRLRGKGMPNTHGGHGDLLATARIALPDDRDPELEELMRKRRKAAE